MKTRSLRQSVFLNATADKVYDGLLSISSAETVDLEKHKKIIQNWKTDLIAGRA